jgi:hypothetical protein
MPDPLMGFALQSFAPPVQPYAVSDACALWTFQAPSRLPANLPPTQIPKHHAFDRPLQKPFGTPPAFRALLRTRVRHITPTV